MTFTVKDRTDNKLHVFERSRRLARSQTERGVQLLLIRATAYGLRLNDAVLVVILEPQVRNQILAAQMAERVLEFHELNEDVVLGV